MSTCFDKGKLSPSVQRAQLAKIRKKCNSFRVLHTANAPSPMLLGICDILTHKHSFIALFFNLDHYGLFSLTDSMIQHRSCIYSAQSSLSIFTQNYLRKCKDIYFMLQNKYLFIYEDSFGAKILKDDCALWTWIHKSSDRFSPPLHL